MVKDILLVAVSDLHCNSTIGLCPSEGVEFDEGGRYIPSHAQEWQWDRWLSFWDTVDQERRRTKSRLFLLFNGDLVDGIAHHGNTSFITANAGIQQYVAEQTLLVPKKLKPERVWVVRGTEVHVGSGGYNEEALAKWLRAEREPEAHTWSRWIARLNLYGVRIDARHHGRVGTRPWTRANAPNALAQEIVLSHVERGLDPPHLALRSHKHTYADTFNNYVTRVISLPAWQLATPYAHKVVTEQVMADIGGVLVYIHPDGTYEATARLYRPPPAPEDIEEVVV